MFQVKREVRSEVAEGWSAGFHLVRRAVKKMVGDMEE